MNTLRLLPTLSLLVAAAAVAAQPTPAPDAASVTALKALQKEYDDALSAYNEAIAKATTDAERRRVHAEKHPETSEYAPRFAALAKRFPRSPIAVDALSWVVNRPLAASVPESSLRTEALRALGKDYLFDPRVGSLCTQLVFSVDPASETFLRAVLKGTDIEGNKARAATSLAVNLKHRARLVPRLADKETAAAYEKSWGRAALRETAAGDPAEMRKESARLFKTVIDSFGTVKHPTHGTLAALARTHLAALEDPVAVGKAAPDVAAEDFDSKVFRLSDYKGKVVLLDFWANSFGPSRAMYAYERGLVRRMEGKPFALIGVNGDNSWRALKPVVAEEKISWRNFWDNGNIGGPIATRYEVDLWPTLFVIDHKGIVRSIHVGWPDTKELDKALDDLVAAAKGG